MPPFYIFSCSKRPEINAGLVASNSEARRLIKQGGVKLNGEKIDNANLEVEPAGELILQAGKRRFARVFFT